MMCFSFLPFSHSFKLFQASYSTALQPLQISYIYFGDNHYSFFQNSQGFGRRFPIHSLWEHFHLCLCSCSSMCDVKLFLPLTLHLFTLFRWKNCRKNSLQLDFDPTSFTPYKQYIHRNVGSLVNFVCHLSFLWGHFQLKLCYCSSICEARESVHLKKLYVPSYTTDF